MKLMSLSVRCWTLALLVLPFASGCGGGGSSSPSAEATPDRSTGSTASTDTGRGDSTRAGNVQTSSTFASATVVEGEGTQPAQSVAIFLDSLRRGDETAANSVLTSKARSEMAKTNYVLQPLGTPDGQYTIGRVGYPYAEKDVALVECNWSEPPIPGEPQVSMDIVCEVHEEIEGWRISGIGVTLTGTEDPVVLDFEDAASLQATIDAATGQTSSPPIEPAGSLEETSTASQPFDNLPTLPNFPEEGNSTASPDQIALPPISDAPARR